MSKIFYVKNEALRKGSLISIKLTAPKQNRQIKMKITNFFTLLFIPAPLLTIPNNGFSQKTISKIAFGSKSFFIKHNFGFNLRISFYPSAGSSSSGSTFAISAMLSSSLSLITLTPWVFLPITRRSLTLCLITIP
jgi:hypothetical protein